MSRIAPVSAVAGVATTAPVGRAASAVPTPETLAPLAGAHAVHPQSQQVVPSIANLAPAQ